VGPFYVKTVTEGEELKQALRLRYQVFQSELGGSSRTSGLDIDEFDFQCDHLIIVEKKTAKVVGTFRLQSSEFSKSFHAAREFELATLLSPLETKLELGRACIHKEYRRGMASSLLWRGVAEYMVQSRAKAVFGCAGFRTADPRKAALLFQYFRQNGRVEETCLVGIQPCFAVSDFAAWESTFDRSLTTLEVAEAEALIPFVCRGLLKSGARIVSKPAWDERMKNIDFLTILRRDDLNRTQWKES
jgi:putative hemolysin